MRAFGSSDPHRRPKAVPLPGGEEFDAPRFRNGVEALRLTVPSFPTPYALRPMPYALHPAVSRIDSIESVA